MANLISMKERTLLIHSEIIKEYPDILEILEQNKNITRDLANSLPDKQKIFIFTLLNQIVKQAINEWKSDPKQVEDRGKDSSNWKRCSLDNQPNRYIFFIINKLNQTVLNIGSECIKEFWYSWKDYFNGKNITQLKQDATRFRLLNELNNKIPGITRTIDQWNNFTENYEIILPKSIEKPYKELGLKASRLYQEYLDEKVDLSCVAQIVDILNERTEIIKLIDEYSSKNINDKFIPKKSIRSWLKNNSLSNVIDMLKEDGRITWGTAHRIMEPEFMKFVVSELNSNIEKLGFSIISIDSSRKGYILEALRRQKIRLFSHHSDLIKFCGWLLFNEEPIYEFTLNNLMKYSITNDQSSLESIIASLGRISSRYHIELEVEHSHVDQNELLIHNILMGEYYFGNLKEIAENYKGLVIDRKSISEEEFIKYIQSITGKRYDKDEIKDIRKVREDLSKERYKRYQ